MSYTQFILKKEKEKTAATLSGEDDMITLHILLFFPSLSHLHYKPEGQTSIHKSDASILIWRAFPIPLGSPRGAIAALLPEHIILRTE